MAIVDEGEWLRCEDPEAMLLYLDAKASARKLRLFACWCARLQQGDGEPWDPSLQVFEHVIQLAERRAEGEDSAEQLERTFQEARALVGDVEEPWKAATFASTGHADALTAALQASDAGIEHSGWLASRQVDGMEYFRDANTERAQFIATRIHVDLIRELFGNPFRSIPFKPIWRVVNESAALHLAQMIDENHDFDRLPILADALEEAGCDSEGLLQHCRRPGGHLRGCWAVDTVRGRE